MVVGVFRMSNVHNSVSFPEAGSARGACNVQCRGCRRGRSISTGISARFVHVMPSSCETHTTAGSRTSGPVEQLTPMNVPIAQHPPVSFPAYPSCLLRTVMSMCVPRPWICTGSGTAARIPCHPVSRPRVYLAGLISLLCGSRAFSTGTRGEFPTGSVQDILTVVHLLEHLCRWHVNSAEVDSFAISV